ncbi:hypothetical protein BsWGS_26574 [Bradybaena similaris]
MDNLTNVCEATSQSQELDNIRPTHRKGRKLLAEKKRRARINNCLMQIRQLVCEEQDEQDTDIDKMEKAEILEKTLEVLTRLRHENPRSSNTASSHTAMAVRYASGFSLCAEESIRYIQNSHLVPSEVKVQLQNHLRAIARRVELTVQVNGQNLTSGFPASSSTSPSSDKLLAGKMQSSFSDNSSAVEQVLAQCSGDVSEGSDCYITSPLCYPTEGSSRYITSPIFYSTPLPLHLPFIKSPMQEVDHSHLNYSSKPYALRSVDQRRKSIRRRAPEVLGKSTRETLAKNTLSLSSGSLIDQSEGYWSDSSQPKHRYLPQSSSSSSFLSTSFYSDSSFTNPPASGATSSLVSTTHSLPHRTVYTNPRFRPYFAAPSILGEPTQVVSNNLLTSTIKEITPPSKVLDLCVKRTDDQQVSPETMWRPW